MKYDSLIKQAAQKYSIPESLIRAVIGRESSGNPGAVSDVGAIGLMQIMPATARDLGIDPTDPAQNIDGGTRYLRDLLVKYKDPNTALAAYNWGPGNVDSGKQIPSSVQTYASNVLSDANAQTGGQSQMPAPSKGGGLVDAAKGVATREGIKYALGSSGSSVANATEASQAAFNAGANAASGVAPEVAMQSVQPGLATTAEANAAFNAGGTEATNAVPFNAGPLGAAAGLYGLYDIGTRWGSGDRSVKGIALGAGEGAASGAAIGSYIMPGPGTLIGAVAGGLYGLAGTLIKVGKSKDQMARDSIRAALKGIGALDDGYNIENADGSKFNLGIDGHAQYQNIGSNIDGRGTRNAWDVDFSNPMAGQAVGWANPIAAILAGGDKKLQSDSAGMLVNAATSNAKSLEDVRANIKTYFDKMGLDSDGATNILKGLKDQGKLTQDDYNAAVYGLGTLVSGKYQTPKEQAQSPNLNPVVAPTQKPTMSPVPNIKPVPGAIGGAILKPGTIPVSKYPSWGTPSEYGMPGDLVDIKKGSELIAGKNPTGLTAAKSLYVKPEVPTKWSGLGATLLNETPEERKKTTSAIATRLYGGVDNHNGAIGG